jgi:hypothetical protein
MPESNAHFVSDGSDPTIGCASLPNVDLNHAIDYLARKLDWLDTRRPDPVALGRWDFYLFVGFAQWCGRFCGAVGGFKISV